jgi:DNA-directed RNA polymerase specialized sigma24 family protein
MSPARGDPVSSTEQKLDEIARLLALLAMRDRPLQETVGEMSSLGFGPTRIAQLLGTSPAYAKVAANRAKQKQKKAKSAPGRTK